MIVDYKKLFLNWIPFGLGGQFKKGSLEVSCIIKTPQNLLW